VEVRGDAAVDRERGRPESDGGAHGRVLLRRWNPAGGPPSRPRSTLRRWDRRSSAGRIDESPTSQNTSRKVHEVQRRRKPESSSRHVQMVSYREAETVAADWNEIAAARGEDLPALPATYRERSTSWCSIGGRGWRFRMTSLRESKLGRGRADATRASGIPRLYVTGRYDRRTACRGRASTNGASHGRACGYSRLDAELAARFQEGTSRAANGATIDVSQTHLGTPLDSNRATRCRR